MRGGITCGNVKMFAKANCILSALSRRRETREVKSGKRRREGKERDVDVRRHDANTQVLGTGASFHSRSLNRGRTATDVAGQALHDD